MSRPQSQSNGYVLKFISGKYQGGEFPLEMGDEIEIGRSSELDMVLVEDMVSRRHARITADDGVLEIEDFGSTNGTFVNGKKINQTEIEKGDRILIGTSIIKLVEQDEPIEEADQNLEAQGNPEDPTTHEDESPNTGEASPVGSTEPQDMDNQTGGVPGSGGAEMPGGDPAGGDVPANQTHAGTAPVGGADQTDETMAGGAGKKTMAGVGNDQPAGGGGQPQQPSGGNGGATLTGSISGLIEEVPLPDLLQLFSTSQKSGVLVVHRNDDVGKVYLRDGRVYYASINDDPDISSHKAFYRMLSWEEGTFSLEQATEESFDDEIDESIENLLMEGMRQLDEIRNLGDDVPDFQETLAVNKPLVPPLRSLTDELLDTLQLVYNYNRVSTVLNKSLASDLETMQDIVHLIRKDYVNVQERGE